MAKVRPQANTAWSEAQSAFEEDNKNREYVRRFRLPPGTERRICFISDAPQRMSDNSIKVYEHNVQMPGAKGKAPWWRQFTSPTTFDVDAVDPLQDAGSNPQLVVFYTIVDMSAWKDRNGKTHKYQKQLLGAKKEAFGVIQAAIKPPVKKGRSLHGAVFTVTRGSEKTSSATGTSYVFEKYLSDENLLALMQKYDPKADLAEFDISEILKPLSERELKVIARRAFGAGAVDVPDDDEDDDENEKPVKKSRKIAPEEDDDDVDEDADDDGIEDPFTDDED